MDSQHVKLVDAHEPVDDAVRPVHDLADQPIFEFRNCPARFGEWDQSICRRYEAGDDDRRVVRRVLTDERANRSSRHALARSTEQFSRQELLLDLVVGYELARVRLAKSFFDLRDEAQPLNGVVDRGVFGHGPKRLDGSRLLGDFHVHDSTIVKLSFMFAVSPLPLCGRPHKMRYTHVVKELRNPARSPVDVLQDRVGK